MDKIPKNILRVESNCTQQVNWMFHDGLKMMMEKLKSENRRIRKYELVFYFNRRDADITDIIGGVYKRMIDIAEQIVGWESQEVMLLTNTELAADHDNSYSIDIIFHLV